MSDLEKRKEENQEDREPDTSGPSLILLYSLLALGLAAAIGAALLIVLPFYRRVPH